MPAARTMEAAKKLFQGDPGACWRLPEEVASPHGNGYVRISVQGTRWFAHRLSYVLFVGQIPDGLVIDHVCHGQDDTCPGGHSCWHRQCVNPDHLEAVSNETNVLRGLSPTAHNARKDRCSDGHPLVVRPSGRYARHCPTCRMRNRIATGETSGNGRWLDRKVCVNGHPFDEANTKLVTTSNGKIRRKCRACDREQARTQRAKKRAASH